MDKAIDKIIDHMSITCEIECSKCGKKSQLFGYDDYISAEIFKEDGWKATDYNVYCKDCAAKVLKKKSKI